MWFIAIFQINKKTKRSFWRKREIVRFHGHWLRAIFSLPEKTSGLQPFTDKFQTQEFLQLERYLFTTFLFWFEVSGCTSDLHSHPSASLFVHLYLSRLLFLIRIARDLARNVCASTVHPARTSCGRTLARRSSFYSHTGFTFNIITLYSYYWVVLKNIRIGLSSFWTCVHCNNRLKMFG